MHALTASNRRRIAGVALGVGVWFFLTPGGVTLQAYADDGSWTAESQPAESQPPESLPPESLPPESRTAESWTPEKVGETAAARAPVAALIEAERRSLAQGSGRRRHGDGGEAGLMQAVLGHMADHERNRVAGQALELHWRVIGLRLQLDVADESLVVLERLTSMARRAEELDVPDGDPGEARGRMLEARDTRVRLEYGERLARRRLAGLLGHQDDWGESLVLVGNLPSELAVVTTTDAVEIALARRSDLRAAETLCRCMTADNLPAARAMLGVLRPGLGMAISAATRPTLLAGMHQGSAEQAELQCRRQQCRILRDSIRDSIRDEVAVADSGLWEAGQRVRLARERWEIAERSARRSESAVGLDRQPPGSDLLSRLEMLRLRGEWVQRRVELALADVRLRQAQGILPGP